MLRKQIGFFGNQNVIFSLCYFLFYIWIFSVVVHKVVEKSGTLIMYFKSGFGKILWKRKSQLKLFLKFSPSISLDQFKLNFQFSLALLKLLSILMFNLKMLLLMVWRNLAEKSQDCNSSILRLVYTTLDPLLCMGSLLGTIKPDKVLLGIPLSKVQRL